MRNYPMIKFLYGGPPPGLVGFGTFLCCFSLPIVASFGDTLGRRSSVAGWPLMFSPFVWGFLLGLFSMKDRPRAITAGIGLVIFPLVALLEAYLRFGNSFDFAVCSVPTCVLASLGFWLLGSQRLVRLGIALLCLCALWLIAEWQDVTRPLNTFDSQIILSAVETYPGIDPDRLYEHYCNTVGLPPYVLPRHHEDFETVLFKQMRRHLD